MPPLRATAQKGADTRTPRDAAAETHWVAHLAMLKASERELG